MAWLSLALLACAVVVLAGAEWPRLARRAGLEGRRRRTRTQRRSHLKLLRSESDEFAASVQRDLERLPTVEERDGKR